MSRTPMTDLQIEMDRLGLVCALLAQAPIDEMLEAFQRAHSLGPILDPTGYHQALYDGDMDAAIELLHAARPLQRKYADLQDRFGKDRAMYPPTDIHP